MDVARLLSALYSNAMNSEIFVYRVVRNSVGGGQVIRSLTANTNYIVCLGTGVIVVVGNGGCSDVGSRHHSFLSGKPVPVVIAFLL